MRTQELEDIFAYIEGNLHDDEPMGLFHIVNPALSELRAGSPELITFVDLCIQEVLRVGGRPCVPGYPIWEEDWVEEPRCGSEPEAIRRAVLDEWIAAGAGQIPFWTGVFFGVAGHVSRLIDVTPRSKQVR